MRIRRRRRRRYLALLLLVPPAPVGQLVAGLAGVQVLAHLPGGQREAGGEAAYLEEEDEE